MDKLVGNFLISKCKVWVKHLLTLLPQTFISHILITYIYERHVSFPINHIITFVFYPLFLYVFLYLGTQLSIERRLVLRNSRERRREAFWNLIRFATSLPRAATSWRPIAESRVYENSDSLPLSEPLLSLASFPLHSRKSVQTIYHVLYIREKSRNCRPDYYFSALFSRNSS